MRNHKRMKGIIIVLFTAVGASMFGVCIVLSCGCTTLRYEHDRPDLVHVKDPSDMWQAYSWSTKRWLGTNSWNVVTQEAYHVCIVGAHMNVVWVEKDLGYAATAAEAKRIIRKDLGKVF